MRNLIAFVMACVVPLASGWACTGHMIVAAIAQQTAPAETMACIAKLDAPLRGAGNVSERHAFVESACWADDIKKDTALFSAWHFADHPVVTDILTGSTPDAGAGMNVERALLDLHRTLRPRFGDPMQAFALRMLVHLVGDIHQPLHTTSRFGGRFGDQGDRGGNEFRVKFPHAHELHALWDRAGDVVRNDLHRPLSDQDAAYVASVAADIIAAHASDAPDLSFHPARWANESYTLAATVAYRGIEFGAAPTDAYTSELKTVALDRLFLAGARLAELLRDKLHGDGAAGD